MKNSKDYLIAILTGLLALTLFTQSAQSATKTYDAVKLVQYAACLADESADASVFAGSLQQCVMYRP